LETRVDRLAQLVKASEPAPGYDEVMLAGEPEWRCERQREQAGIPVPVKLWQHLTTIAGELKITPPRPDPSH
jgi:LDH2 family malate/lactate/ureidoglycolate dehydrogenase